MTTRWSTKYAEATEVDGTELEAGDVTVDMFGNLYLIVAPAGRPTGFDTDVVERRDLDSDGNVIGEFTFFVDATEKFALYRKAS